MINKINNLSKTMLIYQWLYSTERPTKLADSVIKKMKRAFITMRDNGPSMYETAQKRQIDLYAKAWYKAFNSEDEGKVIAISHLVIPIYNSIDEAFFNKIVGKKVMDKLIHSYYISVSKRYPTIDDLEVEKNSNRLTDAVLELFDGKKELSAFEKKIAEMKQNKVLEEKNLEVHN